MKPALLALVAVLAAGLTPSVRAAQPATIQAPLARACFYAQNANNFAAADDRNLYVRVGAREVYHLTMFGQCFDLKWVRSLGLQSRGGSFICEGQNVAVDVVTRDAGPGLQTCPVTAIRRLTRDEVAALPRKARP